MFRKIPFTKTELDIIATTPAFGNRPGFPIRNTPVTQRENLIALYYDKKPFWMPGPGDGTGAIVLRVWTVL